MFDKGWILYREPEATAFMYQPAPSRTVRAGVLAVALLLIGLSIACGPFLRKDAAESPAPVPVAASPEAPVSVPSPPPAGPLRDGRERVVGFLMAEDLEQRLSRAEDLCRAQQEFVDRKPEDPAGQAALAWLADFLDPRDERARARGRLGPRNGMSDVHHSPGYELYVQAGDGLLLFDREGVLIGWVGKDRGELVDAGFHDVDEDGQAEIFLAYESGTNSGNRYTEVVGYKEVLGVVRPVLERRVYDTAGRWMPTGLGPRLSTVKLAGQVYVVLSQGHDAEFLRWDRASSGFVVESAPARRAFLE
jgi:hypothetical protein